MIMSRETAAAVLQSADTAINRVLEAERSAEDAIVVCRGEALGILREARNQARRITNRSEQRVRLVHQLSDQSMERALTAFRAESEVLKAPVHLTPELEQALDQALEQLVLEITGAHP